MKDFGRNVFVIVGKQGAGKSTFGRAFAAARGTEFHETSEWLVEVETRRQRALRERYQISRWMLKNYAPNPPNPDGTVDLDEGFDILHGWDDLRDRPARELLVALGDAVNEIDPTFLSDRCFERGDVCAGVRRRAEFEALYKKYGDRLNVVLIEGRQGPQVDLDNFELTLEFLTATMKEDVQRLWVVYNEGDEESFKARARSYAAECDFAEQQG